MSPKPITQNTLFYGDNLPIMREYISDESIDLIYLDPPFNSNRSYNVLFKDETGTDSEAQMEAFDDTWHWGESAEKIYHELVTGPNQAVGNMIAALRQFIGGNKSNSGNQMMAYLVMMAARLVEMHRVLKPTGSLYLHCDPTASHYLKIILDSIFGTRQFNNEIIWHYGGWTHHKMSRFPRKHDVILFYAKDSENTKFNPISIPWTREEYISLRKQAIHIDEDGREYIYDERGSDGAKRFLDIALQEGRPIDSVWDIRPLTSSSKERLGYPTQKPIALLNRIIQASSNPGDVVLDPFSGCGTAISAAQELNRRWIGIDITHLAIAMHKSRLKDMYRLEAGSDYQVIGEPTDLESARALAREDRYQFQWWALSLINARPIGGQESGKRGKKGSDQGIDGVIPFVSGFKGEYSKVIVQVKSGNVKSGDIRDLHGVLEREKDSAIGLFLTLESPTREMTREAVSAGFYTSPLWQQDFPKIQILTIEEILNGARIQMPPGYTPFKIAEKVKKTEGTQTGFEF